MGISAHFSLNPDFKTIERETYGFFTYVGDIGGIHASLILIFGSFAYPFSAIRMNALLTNRLHHIS